MNKKNLKLIKKPPLKEEDGQLKKLEENRSIHINKEKPLFSKDVNDPSERGND